MECPVAYTIRKIGGRWKPIVLYQLSTGRKRYSELRKAIPAISEKMLIETLRELEEDGIIERHSKPVVPPFVEYSLSRHGKTLKPILDAMAQWGIRRRHAASA